MTRFLEYENKMNLLALDTSTEVLSLAVQKGDEWFTRDTVAGQTHSQQILPLIRSLLSEADLTLQDLHGIAYCEGPGSFTGLRIACGVAQGLAFGAGLPVVGVSTLLALAENSGADKVIACLDARMGEVYHAAYEKQTNGWAEISPAGLFKPVAVPAITGENWVGVGTGWVTFNVELSQVYQGNISEIKLGELIYDHPMASAILQLAKPQFEAGLGQPAVSAQPVYIRNKVALKTVERMAKT